MVTTRHATLLRDTLVELFLRVRDTARDPAELKTAALAFVFGLPVLPVLHSLGLSPFSSALLGISVAAVLPVLLWVLLRALEMRDERLERLAENRRSQRASHLISTAPAMSLSYIGTSVLSSERSGLVVSLVLGYQGMRVVGLDEDGNELPGALALVTDPGIASYDLPVPSEQLEQLEQSSSAGEVGVITLYAIREQDEVVIAPGGVSCRFPSWSGSLA